MPSRSAVSGVRSTLTSPRMRSRPKIDDGGARLPDDVAVDVRAGLDVLERVDRGRPGATTASSPIVVWSPIAAFSPMRTCERMSHIRPTTAPSIDRLPADVRRRVDDRAGDPRVLAQRRRSATAPSRRRSDASRVDPAVHADERGPLDGRDVAELDSLAHPDVAAQADPRDLELDALVERVEVRLAVLVEVPDVLPVALDHVAVHRAALLEEEREELLGEVVRLGPRGRSAAPRARIT